MKYFSLQTVKQAYKANSASTRNKFWGLLSILSSLEDCVVKPGVSYDFDTTKVSTFLENLFCLENVKKTNFGSSTWNIMLSTKWTEKVPEQMLIKTPNIYNVIVWYFRTKGFYDGVNESELLQCFLSAVHISLDDAKQLFDFSHRDISFENYLYAESDLHQALGIQSKNITAESSAIVAHPGELSRAPFIQTLYAGQGALECLLVTPFRFSELYGGGKSKSIGSKDLQKIFFGTPGSGKSYKVKGIVEGQDEFTFRTTFHPDSDYATFVGAYKPVKVGTELTYEFVPQAFTDAYVKAWNFQDEDIYLVIEEINRGNCAQIFGDLFQLLDRDDQNVSRYPINADKDLRKYLETEGILGEGHEGIKDGKLKLPDNFHILATMNTSDQSLFPMDSAFKRRWSWEYVPIKTDDTVRSKDFTIDIDGNIFNWHEFLKAVNKKIARVSESEDKQMGNFFIGNSIKKEEFKSKVMFYLWSEVCKDEYKHNSFFKYKDNGAEKEFSFNDLFSADGDKILPLFIQEVIDSEKEA